MPGLRSSTSIKRMPLPSSVDSRRSERSSRAVASSYSVSRAIDPEDPVVRIEVVLVPLLIEPLYGQDGAASVSPPSRFTWLPAQLPACRTPPSALTGAARRAARVVTSRRDNQFNATLGNDGCIFRAP